MKDCKDAFAKIAIITNVCLDTYIAGIMESLFKEHQVKIYLDTFRYENFRDEKISFTQYDTICVLLNFATQFQDHYIDIISGNVLPSDISKYTVELCENLLAYIKSKTNLPIIWFGFEDYILNDLYPSGSIGYCDFLVDKINYEISKMVGQPDVFIDFKRIIARIGINDSFDTKNYYRWNAIYSKPLLYEIFKEIFLQYMIYMNKTKKCVVLDCDNVLWGGIISEVGIENIELSNSGPGKKYQDFQRYILSLYYHGVIIALCSKNDIDDVIKVFKEHTGMKILLENLACVKVNWKDKVNNIIEISNELDIGLDSIVFIDDSEFEIQALRNLLPQVSAIRFDEQIYKKLFEFHFKYPINSSDVMIRHVTYRSNIQRKQLQHQCVNISDYISALDMKISITKSVNSEIQRIAELSQRANKCTNGMRYTANELESLIENEKMDLYSVYVKDRFSDLGLVGCIGILKMKLIFFVLSCRALGRNVEEQMINFIKDKKITDFLFTSTQKNNELFDKLTLQLKEPCT